MPGAKKKKGGNKKRRGKNKQESNKRELIFADDGQTYAHIIRVLGNGRFESACTDGVKRMLHVRGAMRKRVWINKDDLVLVGIRDFQPYKGDIIHKYTAEEARALVRNNNVPEAFMKMRGNDGDDDDNDGDRYGVDILFEFADDNEDGVFDLETMTHVKSVDAQPTSRAFRPGDEDGDREVRLEDL